jgi:hypothetical protein
MRGKVKILLLCIALLIVPGLVTAGQAQTSGGPVDFNTGHTVTGAFLDQYYSLSNPLEIYGLPITDEFEGMSSYGITTVQYFTKARFDLLKDINGADKIEVADLGEFMYPGPGPLAPVPTDGPTCRYFSATGKSVCYAFLQYYDANDGAANFGNPISDLEVLEGRYVQYFEKVRMEWQPERESDSHVVLTDLGKRYFDLAVNDPSLTLSEGSAAPGEPRQPKAFAFVARALISANSQQTVYVVVYDMYRKPVANAQVWIYVKTPDGQITPYRAPDTNPDGISILTFPVGDLAANQVVELQVQVMAAGEGASAQSWFRVWY